MMRTTEQRRVELLSCANAFLAYRNSDQMRCFVGLIEALLRDHMADLTNVKPEGLLFKQGAIRQLQSLRDIVCSDSPHISPKA